MELTVGGKTDRWHGDPVAGRGRVRLLCDGQWVHEGPENAGVPVDMGPTAVLRCGGVNLVLTSHKSMPGDQQQLKSVGIDPLRQQIIVVKAAVRWRGGYGPIARHAVYADTPGLGSVDLRRFPYQHIRRPIFPLDPETAFSPAWGRFGRRTAGPITDAGESSQMDAEALATEIDQRIRSLPDQSTEPVRAIRREYSRRLRDVSAAEVLAVAEALVGRQRWVAYELLYHHPSRLAGLTTEAVERLGQGIDGWDAVDAFARYISGPAWQQGLIPDAAIQRWTTSPDRYWRRAALVSTVPLNLRAAGGTGDTERTLDICTRLVADRDDMVVKALSWALRELAYLGSRGGAPISGGPPGRRRRPGPAGGATQARDRTQEPTTVSGSGTGEVTRSTATFSIRVILSTASTHWCHLSASEGLASSSGDGWRPRCFLRQHDTVSWTVY